MAERSAKGKGKVAADLVEPVGEVGGHPVVNVPEGKRVVVCGLLFDPAGYEKMWKPKKAKKDPSLPPLPPRRSLRKRVVKPEPLEQGGCHFVETVTMVMFI